MQIPPLHDLTNAEQREMEERAQALSFADLSCLLVAAFRPWERRTRGWVEAVMPNGPSMPGMVLLTDLPAPILQELASRKRLIEEGFLREPRLSTMRLTPRGAKLTAVVLQLLQLQPIQPLVQ